MHAHVHVHLILEWWLCSNCWCVLLSARLLGRLPGRIKSRISTDDLVCFLESKPRLAKSHGLFRYLAKRGAENYRA